MITVEPILLDVDLSVEEYELEYSESESFDLDMDMAIIVNNIEGEKYHGPTEVTPTQSTQELLTAGKVVLSNITVNPIPSNYGLITYNGSVLTVS